MLQKVIEKLKMASESKPTFPLDILTRFLIRNKFPNKVKSTNLRRDVSFLIRNKFPNRDRFIASIQVS